MGSAAAQGQESCRRRRPFALRDPEALWRQGWFQSLDGRHPRTFRLDRKSTRLNSSHGYISYAVFCLKKKKKSFDTSCTLHRCPHVLPAHVIQTVRAARAYDEPTDTQGRRALASAKVALSVGQLRQR